MRRRTFLTSVALAGAAVSLPWKELPAAESSAPFELPKLGFAFDALEPNIDTHTMEIHYTKHHKAYVDNLNKALAAAPPAWRQKSLSELLLSHDAPANLKGAIRNQGGGHYNHSLFWKIITPGGESLPGGPLGSAIDQAFGSFEDFRKQFNAGAVGRFGSGWEWLCQGRDRKLTLLSTANQDCPLSEGYHPLLGFDVWEHAYYLKYQNRRADYLAALWNVVNWTEVGSRFRQA